MAPDAVWINLIKFGREARMLATSFEREDVDARHQGVAGRMALRAVDLRVKGGLLPERRFLLLTMAGQAKPLFRCRIGGQSDGGIKDGYDQNASQRPGPEWKMGDL